MAATSNFTCPRRMNEFGPWGREPGMDSWRTVRDSYHMSPVCSFCGSISPDAFFAAVEAGAEIGPTDKSYKVYVEVPNPRPDALRVSGGSSGGDTPPSFGDPDGWKRESEMTDEEFELAKDCGWLVEERRAEGRDRWILFDKAGPISHGKFYFQHLDDEGKDRFIALVNGGKMNLGYPGHFYVSPFFTKPREPA